MSRAKRFIAIVSLLFFCAYCAAAQATVTLSGPASARKNTVIPLTLVLSTSTPAPAGIQFTIATSSDISALSVSSSSVLSAIPKSIYCGTFVSGSMTCLIDTPVTGTINDLAIGNITLLTINATVVSRPSGSTIPFTLSNLLGASVAAASITTTANPPISVSVISDCSLTGDTPVSGADVSFAINQVLGVAPVTNCDINGDGKCDIADVQVIAIAASGGGCAY